MGDNKGTTTYKWKPGSIHIIDAGTAGRALDDMISRHGILTPALVVEESRPEDAPLHNAFEWDDAVAAEQYRESQARYIIRTITVEIPNREDAFVRAFVSVSPQPVPTKEPKEGQVTEKATPIYVRTLDALADPALREQILKRAWEELESWQRRYSELKELAKLFQVIQAARQEALQPIAA